MTRKHHFLFLEKIYSTPQEVPFQANDNIRVVSTGPKCSAIVTNKGDLYVTGQNRGQRLLIKGSKILKAFTKAKRGIRDIQCGPSYSILLKTDGQIVNIGNEIERKVKIPEKMQILSIATCKGQEKAKNFGLCVTKSGHVYQWNTSDYSKHEDGIMPKLVDIGQDYKVICLSAEKQYFVVAVEKSVVSAYN